MNEKKSIKKRVCLAVLAVVTIASISIGAVVIGNDDDNAPVAEPIATATATATASPTTGAGAPVDLTDAQKEEIVAAAKANPLGIDFDKMMAEGLASDVMTTFPEEDFDTREGLLTTLQTYQTLNSVEQFYGPRDSSKDFELVFPNAGNIDAEFLSVLERSIQDKGRFTGILTVPGSGDIDEHKAKAGMGVPKQWFAQPAVSVTADGTGLLIRGDGLTDAQRDAGKEGYGLKYSIPLEDEKYFHGSLMWWMEITYTTDGWKIDNMGYQGTGGIITDSPSWEGTNG